MTTFYRQFVRSGSWPWRVRHAVEQWVETSCRRQFPGLYRRFHFGAYANVLRPVTFGPKHHFFGYYEKTPWNASQRLLLVHEADFNDRPPGPTDCVRVGIINLGDGQFEALGESHAWNWQQGAMLAWHPADPERLFVCNDRREGQLVSIVRDTGGAEVRVYSRPIYALSPNGGEAWSLNFARLATHRPGYGYSGLMDPWASVVHPVDDGIHRIDLHDGQSKLIVSLDQLAAFNPKPTMAGQFHWLNHIQPSPRGSRIAFFHLWRQGAKEWGVRLFVCRPVGDELSCVLDTGWISHYDWLDEDRILVWARRKDGGERFLLVDVRNGSYHVYGDGVLTEDGHGTFSPDRRWVLNDTYPDSHDMRTLMLASWPEGRRIDIARAYSPKSKWWGEIRCDLHPRWSRDGRQISIDSVHEGTRQMYLIDVSRWIA